MDMVNLKINGIPVSVEKGSTIFRCCKKNTYRNSYIMLYEGLERDWCLPYVYR